VWYAEECEGIEELLVGGVAEHMWPVAQERTAVVVRINNEELARLNEFVGEHIAGEQHMSRAVAN
jgi:hypothetical protein